MMTPTLHAPFQNRLLMLGFGSIGQAMLPMLFRHLGLRAEQIRIISRSTAGSAIAAKYGIEVSIQTLTRSNHARILEELLEEGDFLLNVSTDVASADLIRFCARRGVLYLDTCTEPWSGGYADPSLSPSQRSNYALREEVLALRREQSAGPTAVITQGANPGLVSMLTKQALLNIASDNDLDVLQPKRREDWARLARQLGIRAIHVAERDTQQSHLCKKRGEFVNTWSVAGFAGEAEQPAELGWGTHERHWPAEAARHEFGCGAAIYLNRPGAATRVRSWTPCEGSYQGFLITHSESISIADYLTVHEHGKVAYRPTVHYAYHPCDDAVLSLHELAGKNWQLQPEHRILRDEITEGVDELGVLLMGNAKGAYWYGSRLDIDEARNLLPYNSATSLQVVAAILGGMIWALRHPHAGIVEPDELDHHFILDIARPYLGQLVGAYTDWTPLRDRSPLYHEETDRADPWQFINFLVR